jgi:hypothetical protein
MFECGVGVSTESTYVVKRVDNNFFEDESGSEVLADHFSKEDEGWLQVRIRCAYGSKQ